MAMIPKMVNVVNRSTKPIDAMFDGQPVVIPPGYKFNKEGDEIIGAGPDGKVLLYPLPYFAGEMVKRQNPVMGTEDPYAPNVFDSLIGVVEWGDPIDHTEQSDAEERMDRSELDDEAQTARPIRKRSKAANRKKGGRRFTDHSLKNPGGIKGEYAS